MGPGWGERGEREIDRCPKTRNMDPRVRLEMGGLGLLLLLVGGRCRGGVQIDGFTTVNLLFCGGRGGRWMDSRVAGSLLAQVMQVVQVVQDSMIARMPHLPHPTLGLLQQDGQDCGCDLGPPVETRQACLQSCHPLPADQDYCSKIDCAFLVEYRTSFPNTLY